MDNLFSGKCLWYDQIPIIDHTIALKCLEHCDFVLKFSDFAVRLVYPSSSHFHTTISFIYQLYFRNCFDPQDYGEWERKRENWNDKKNGK